MALTQLSHDFSMTDAMKEWAEKTVPMVNVEKETEKFKDYWRARGKLMHDWQACWRTWMNKVSNFRGCMYSADEIRIKKLMSKYEPQGFRRAYVHENAVQYSVAFDVWDMKRKQEPFRDAASVIASIAQGKRI
jgi:hypothetical protein